MTSPTPGPKPQANLPLSLPVLLLAAVIVGPLPLDSDPLPSPTFPADHSLPLLGPSLRLLHWPLSHVTWSGSPLEGAGGWERRVAGKKENLF